MRKGPHYECETDSPNDCRDQWSVSHHVALSSDRNQPAAADYSLPRAASWRLGRELHHMPACGSVAKVAVKKLWNWILK
jgi:hypothetical protein